MKLLALLRGASFVFVCRLMGAALTFLSQVLLARWMGADQMGVYVFAFAIGVLLTTISGLGMPAAAIRFIGSGLANDRGDLILGFARNAAQLFAAIGITIAVIGVLVVSIDGVVAADRRTAMLVAFLFVPVYGQLLARDAVALALSWVRAAFLPNAVFRPALFLLLIGLAAYFGVPMDGADAMWLQLASAALVTVGLALAMHWSLKRRFPETPRAYDRSSWMRAATPLLLVGLLTNYFLELNVFIAGAHLGAGDLAVFNASLRTAALVTFGLYAVDAITMPQISRQYAASGGAALQPTVSRASRLRFCGAVAAAVLLAAAGRPILALFGDRFVDGYEALLILAAAQVLSATFGPTARILSVTGFQNHSLRVFAVSLFAMIVLHPLLIERFGINGAAITVLIVVLLQSIWLHALVVRHLGIRAWAFATSNVND